VRSSRLCVFVTQGAACRVVRCAKRRAQHGGASAKTARAEEFYDNSLLLELERDGFFARLK
jgi:hypothetical protein